MRIGTVLSSRSRRPAQLAPYQNATGLQVTSAVLAGIVWMMENPDRGIVEADEMDFRRCLELQRPYLGPVVRPLYGVDTAFRRGEASCSRSGSTMPILGSSATFWWRDGGTTASHSLSSLLEPNLTCPAPLPA